MRALIFAFLLLMAPLTQAAAGSPRIASTTANTADCFFNWAETAYPQYFAPSRQTSQTLDVYYYRYYPGTNAYLAATSSTQHVVYLGPLSGYGLLDLGSLAGWAAQLACATPPAATVTHANGTYSWNPETGVLLSTTTSSDVVCKGPKVGTMTENGVTIGAASMTWPDDGTTWSRTSGIAGDIVGSWAVSDNSTGNTYTITFNSDSSFSFTGNIVQCGNSSGTPTANPIARSQRWPNGYYIRPSYDDANKTAASVSVSGPGISGALSLVYSSYPGNGQGVWESWSLPGSPVSFGTTPPALPYTYTFAITDASGTRTATSTVTCFQEQFATNLQPSGVIPGTPTFSWTGIGDAKATYAVELNDRDGNRIWNTPQDIAATSVVYSGPALTPGMPYKYNVVLNNSSACSNQGSFAGGAFIYQMQAAPISYAGQYTGYYYWNNGANGSNGSGAWTMTVSNNGVVSGQGTATCTGSCTDAGNYPLSGTVTAAGSISFTTSGGDVCAGTISPSNGSILGTCTYAFNGSTGSFSGSKQSNAQNAYLVPVSVTGSTSHVTGAQICVTVADKDTCGSAGGFTVGFTGNIAVSGNLNDSYVVHLPANQPAASFCSVTSGGVSSLGANMPTAVITCR